MTAQTQPEAMLPCPFCGGKALLDEDTGWKAVECEKCGMHGGVALEAGDAITEWNRRAPLDSQQERKPLTGSQIASVCLSYRHDFGLLSKEERVSLMATARAWEHAIDKEHAHGITQEKQR